MSFPDPYPPEHWPSSAQEVEGMEFDWFARDSIGQLAVFTSAGRGFIPRQIFSETFASYNDFIAAIARRQAGSAILEFTGEGCYQDWRDFAKHGLFAYDFHDAHRGGIGVPKRGGYDLIYRPSVPAIQADIPNHVAEYLPLLDTIFGSSDLVPLSVIQASSSKFMGTLSISGVNTARTMTRNGGKDKAFL